MATNKTKEFETFYKQFTTRNYKKGMLGSTLFLKQVLNLRFTFLDPSHTFLWYGR